MRDRRPDSGRGYPHSAPARAREEAHRVRRSAVAVTAIALSAIVGCSRSADRPPSRYPPPLPDGGSVFFVGNSFLGWEGRNLPEWLAALGEAEGVRFVVGGDIEPGDLRLGAFLDHPAVREALASGAYRVWVIQGHEYESVDHPAAFRRAVRDFNNAIRRAGGKTVLFMTWEFPWRRFLPAVAREYDSIGRELGIPVIPVGLAYGDCERSPPPGRSTFFLVADSTHPGGDLHENMFGTALNAYATFATLTGRNPSGRTFAAPGNGIDPRTLRYLSDRAWDRAAPRLEIGASRSP
jgi:hypothetical protein